MGDQIVGNSVKNIFENMHYGVVIESIDQALEWLKQRGNRINAIDPNEAVIELKNVNNFVNEILCYVHIPDSDFINFWLETMNHSFNEWIDSNPLERTELLFMLGCEIQKQQGLFCEIELAIRGILSKDTKHSAIPLLTEFIQFYSSFSVKYGQENPTWKPPGVCVGVFPDETPLSLLGMFLGPSLAAGYNVILQTGPKLSVVATLIQEIAIKIGIPDNTIRVIPGDVDLNAFLSNEHVAIISIFDDLYKDKYNVKNPWNKKILNFSSNGAPIIVFEGADLDSACQCAIEAIWGYQGMTPWSTKTVLIQENIFDDFVNRIKQRIDKVRIGFGDDANADISYPHHPYAVDKLNRIADNARKHGAEIYPDIEFKQFTPTLLIGGNVFNNNVIKGGTIDIPIVNLRRFRTINEAALLANNTRDSLAVAVWTENVNLANEIAQKLDATMVWINGHGSFFSSSPLSPFKNNGGYFGGSQGFYEYIIEGTVEKACSSRKNGAIMEKALKEATKAQIVWSQQTRFERARKLQIFAQSINKETFPNLSNDWINNWVTTIYDYITDDFTLSAHISTNSSQLNSHRKPCGVIVIETQENLELHNKNLIIAALVEGNSVVILDEAKSGRNFYEFVIKNLPNNLLQIVDLSQDAIKIAALYKELNVYFGQNFTKISSTLPLRDCLKFKTNPVGVARIRDKVTVVKNVWTSVGQSFL